MENDKNVLNIDIYNLIEVNGIKPYRNSIDQIK